MKRYDFKAHFDPYYGCDVAEPEEHSDGEWVKASVAQSLYDALNEVRSYYKSHGTGKVYNLGYATDKLRESRLNEALSLADGESE